MIQDYLIDLLLFLNNVVVPLIFSLAFLFFVWNAFRYFILGATAAGDKEKGVAGGRERAKKFALYGILAFVIMVSVWGIVSVLVAGLDIDQEYALCPDYLVTPDCVFR